MKHKTEELEGELLNAAVAKAEGLPVHPGPDRFMVAAPISQRWAHEFDWTESWEDGGPIIERERISVLFDELAASNDDAWIGVRPQVDENDPIGIRGLTPLIAAMRAYIASRFGDEVELP